MDIDLDGAASRMITDDNHSNPSSRRISNIDIPQVKASIFGSVSNLVNSIVGAGIVGIPFAIRESGFVVGVALLFIVSIFTDKSLRLIIDQATFHPKLKGKGVMTFEDLMTIPFGKAGKYFILSSMLILAYGAMVAYLLVIKDTLPTVLGLGLHNSIAERQAIMVVSSFAILLPLSMLRDISMLACTSLLSVVADAVLVVLVAWCAPVKESVAAAGGFAAVLQDDWASNRLFIGLGVLSTAMACQHSAFLISNTLQNHTSERWARVTGISLTSAAIMSLLLGIVGFLGFVNNVQGDILNNFDPNSHIINIARASLALTMFFTYPMEAFVGRHVLAVMFFNGSLDNMVENADGELIPETKWLGVIGKRERWTFYLYVMTLVPALIFDDLGPVLSMTGSIGASSIAYIAPGVVYFGLNGDTFLNWTGDYLRRNGYYSTQRTNEAGDIELPVVGDSSAKIQASVETLHPSNFFQVPWWWYPALMPIWVALASRGSRGCKQFFAGMGIEETVQPSEASAYMEAEFQDDETVFPSKRDFCYSIVFIIFGVIAAVAGVCSNIYVQIHNISKTP
jgi:sodium-coupled neutral amino acid transporter 11